jgi:5-methyltetrahydropteroyltriglutamate--homocysteine methyltransferase
MITTAVGNYPKVAEGAYSTKLIGSLSKWQRKELTDAQLEAVFREITKAVIREQEEAGLELLTDGQVRWEDLVNPIARRLEGFEINGLTRWFNNNVYYRRPILHKPPVRRGPILVEDYRFAASCTRRPVKAVLPGPYTFALMSEDRHYKKLRPLVLRLAEILNEEARALSGAGAPFIQFDEPAVGFGPLSGAGATDVKLAVEALNVAAGGVKAKTAVYTYFGSLNGALGPLMKARVDVIGLDVVSDPKTLSALKRTKVTKELAIGCLDARNTKMEPIKALHAIFSAVKRLVPADRLYVNPNCGLEFLPHAQARAKLRRLVQAVRAYTR